MRCRAVYRYFCHFPSYLERILTVYSLHFSNSPVTCSKSQSRPLFWQVHSVYLWTSPDPLEIYLGLIFSWLGFLELDLHHTIIPAKSSEKCNLDMIPDLKAMNPLKVKTASLFEQKSMKGWWPCYIEKDGSRVMAVCMSNSWLGVVYSFSSLGFALYE